MESGLLPHRFRNLEDFTGWAIPTMEGRVERRTSAAYEDAKAFYDAMFPQLEDVISYLDQYPLHDMPADAQRLAWMVLALVEISMAVEVFHQMDIPKGGPHDRLPIVHSVSGVW